MTKMDRRAIAKMFTFLMRGIICILENDQSEQKEFAVATEKLIDELEEWCGNRAVENLKNGVKIEIYRNQKGGANEN